MSESFQNPPVEQEQKIRGKIRGVKKNPEALPATIPTGLRPPAQGWRSAYLGFTFRKRNNLNEVVAVGVRMKPEWPQPRCG
jgi:hypothetical protein